MGLISTLLKPFNRSAALPAQSAVSVWGYPGSAGVVVTEDTAQALSAVYRAIAVLSDALALLPVHVYRRAGDERERERNSRLEFILNEEPNPFMDGFTFKQTMQSWVLGWGNAIAEKEYRNGELDSLWPIHPSRVRPEYDNGRFVGYAIRYGDSMQEDLLAPEDVLHIANRPPDGVWGRSPARIGAGSFGEALAAQKSSEAFFKNGAKPGGIIGFKDKKNKEQLMAARQAWEAQHRGPDNQHRVAFMGDGPEWQSISIEPGAAQLLETRQWHVTEIARWYGVQPHLIFDLSRATFSNIEQQSLDFYKHSLLPWLRLWESRGKMHLVPAADKMEVFLEFLADAVLRADIATRYQSYSVGRQWGWLSVNDVRRKENMPPVENGDGYMEPLNMRTLGTEPVQPSADQQQQMANATAAQLREIVTSAEREKASILDRLQAALLDKELTAGMLADSRAKLGLFHSETTDLQQKLAESEERIQELAAEGQVAHQKLAAAEEQLRAGVPANEQQFTLALSAAESAVDDAWLRMVAVECNAVLRFADKPSKFLSELEAFYTRHKVKMQEAVLPSWKVVQAIAGADGAESSLLACVEEHCAKSYEQLVEASGCEPDQFKDEITAVVSAWRDRKPERNRDEQREAA